MKSDKKLANMNRISRLISQGNRGSPEEILEDAIDAGNWYSSPFHRLPSTFHSSNFRGKNVQKSRLNARQSCINFSRLICTRGCIQEFIAPRVGWSDHSRVARNLLAHESSRVIVCNRFTTTRLHNVNLSTVTMPCSRGVESKEETEVCM